MHRGRYRKRLIKNLASTKSILFVCKGNICRSPFAAEYAKVAISSKEICIASAGYYPASGRPSPKNAQLASEQLDVLLGSHRSEQLTQQHILESDLVIVFDEENYDRVRNEYSNSVDKVFLLQHINRTGSLFIEDPYGSTKDRFVATYRDIKCSIDAMMEKLKKSASSSQLMTKQQLPGSVGNSERDVDVASEA